MLSRSRVWTIWNSAETHRKISCGPLEDPSYADFFVFGEYSQITYCTELCGRRCFCVVVFFSPRSPSLLCSIVKGLRYLSIFSTQFNYFFHNEILCTIISRTRQAQNDCCDLCHLFLECVSMCGHQNKNTRGSHLALLLWSLFGVAQFL